MRKVIFAAAFLATPVAAEVPTVPIANDFHGISYSIDSGGSVEIYAAPRDAGGKLAICGLVIFEKATATTRALERRFSERISFTLGGKAVRVHTDSFKRYKSMDEANAADKAGCSVLNSVPWDPAYAKTELKMDLVNTTITY